jgi:hypothetical protein
MKKHVDFRRSLLGFRYLLLTIPIVPLFLVATATNAAAANWQLINYQTQTCMDSPSGNVGQLLVGWSCNYGNNQYWQVNYNSGYGYYVIYNPYYNKCLDIDFFSNRPEVYPCGNYTTQFWWRVWDNSRSAEQLHNVNTGQCLDLSGGNSGNGTPVIMYTCYSNHNNQYWIPNYFL